jgi:hypothetical protein
LNLRGVFPKVKRQAVRQQSQKCCRLATVRE